MTSSKSELFIEGAEVDTHMSKVLLVNGSPHAQGCTYTALMEVASELERRGVQSEVVQVPYDTPGCRDCRHCYKAGRCVNDDLVNAIGSRLDEFGAIVLGSPVYYAGPSGQMCSFADRLFYAYSSRMDGKLGACVVSCRRGGATAAFDRLNKYFLMNNMPVVPSQYWNQVHGSRPEDVMQDAEGLQTMRTLAANIAWMLGAEEASEGAGRPVPEREAPMRTDFIRRSRCPTRGRRSVSSGRWAP